MEIKKKLFSESYPFISLSVTMWFLSAIIIVILDCIILSLVNTGRIKGVVVILEIVILFLPWSLLIAFVNRWINYVNFYYKDIELVSLLFFRKNISCEKITCVKKLRILWVRSFIIYLGKKKYYIPHNKMSEKYLGGYL